MVKSTEQQKERKSEAVQRRILVVEDSVSYGRMFQNIVERTGAVVDLAANLGEAITQVENHVYDVALVDIMLSDDVTDRGGMTVIERIRDIGQRTCVVVISATHDVRVPVAAFENGAFAYLVKNSIKSSDDILRIVRKAIEASSRTAQNKGSTGDPEPTPPLTDNRTWLPNKDKRERFERLAEAWERDSAHLSSPIKMAMLSSYQEIIGMGPDAVTLILERLSSHPDHWFWALRAITGVDPVSSENVGRIDKMAEEWLRWGKQNGIIG